MTSDYKISDLTGLPTSSQESDGNMGNDLPTLPLGTVRVTNPQLISCIGYTKLASCAKALTSSNNVSCTWARGVCIETPTRAGANDSLRGNFKPDSVEDQGVFLLLVLRALV